MPGFIYCHQREYAPVGYSEQCVEMGLRISGDYTANQVSTTLQQNPYSFKKKKPGGSARVHYKCSVQKKWVVMVQPVIKMVIQAMNSGNFTAKFKHSSE